MKKQIKAVIYTRVATAAQLDNGHARAILYARSATGEGDAVARQITTCRTWANQHGYHVQGEYTEVISGLATNPPQRAKAIAQAEQHEADLIVFDPARLSRDAGIFTRIMSDCQRRGVAVHFVNVER